MMKSPMSTEAIRGACVASDLDLLVPSLWLFEVGNTLARKYAMQAETLLEILASLQIPEAPMTEEWRGITLGLGSRREDSNYFTRYVENRQERYICSAVSTARADRGGSTANRYPAGDRNITEPLPVAKSRWICYPLFFMRAQASPRGSE